MHNFTMKVLAISPRKRERRVGVTFSPGSFIAYFRQFCSFIYATDLKLASAVSFSAHVEYC